MNLRAAPILAAEDEETDAFILRLAFQRAKLPNPLVVVRDGEEAVCYLSGSAPFQDRAMHPLPGLLLLDLKMPRMTGFDVLAWLAEQEQFRNLPTVVLSSSSDESDMAEAHRLGARDYFVKPHSVSDFQLIIETVRTRWLTDPSLE